MHRACVLLRLKCILIIADAVLFLTCLSCLRVLCVVQSRWWSRLATAGLLVLE
jgi:hypothetical protein